MRNMASMWYNSSTEIRPRCCQHPGEWPNLSERFSMSIIPLKRCTKCGADKPLSDFGKQPRSLDGYWHVCRLCIRYRKTPNYLDYIAQGLDYCFTCKQWKEAGGFVALSRSVTGRGSRCLDCHRAISRDYNRRNRSKVAQTGNAWRRANRERHLETRRAWRAIPGNAERERARNRAWSKHNMDAIIAIQHKRRALKKANGGTYTARQWKALCARYDNRCLCCGRKRRLSVDHIVPIIKGGANSIDNLQPLCKPCNSRKGSRVIDFRPDKGAALVQASLFEEGNP